jgi:hypothetical protein
MASGQAVATWKTYRTLDAQPTGVNIKASPGEVSGWFIVNNSGAVRYVKLYDKATAPTSGDTPLITLGIPGGSAANVLSESGIDFASGIGIRCTQLFNDNDTTAPTANDVVLNIFYK